MTIADDLTPLEILGVAIKSEIEAANLYRYMAGQVVNLDLRGRLDFLAKEEEKHGHYELLRTELEMIQRFPTYYQVKDLQLGDELVHFGP